MWWLALLLGACYGLYHSFASFHEPLKNSKYYLLIVPLVAATGGFIWGVIVKNIPKAEDVYKAGSAHDGAIVLVWYIGSLFVFNMKMSPVEYIGIGCILLGTLLLKVG